MSFKATKALIAQDLLRFGKRRGFRRGFVAFLKYPGFRFITICRLTKYARRHPFWRLVSPLLVAYYFWLREKLGYQISYGSNLGGGFYLPHFGAIVVNPKVSIGENCYLSHNVTIGKVHAGEKAGVPEIGKDVFIGVGSVLIGKITVGDNTAIGPNSVVIDDVPANSFVAGAPAKVVSSKGAREILGYND